MLRALFSLQIVLSLLFTGIIYFVAGPHEATSFFSGALYAGLNLALIVFVVARLFRKKSVALTLLLIIFKYTIFGLALYYLVSAKLLMVSWFVVGLSVLLPSVLGPLGPYWKQHKKERGY